MNIVQVKKINRYLPKQSSLQILMTAKVEKGKAVFTDLDNWIEIDTDWKDGLYFRPKIPTQKENSNSNVDIKDFPSMPEIKDTQIVCAIDLINEDITSFCSNDETRESLIGVYLDSKENKAVATDGHRLHCQNIPVKQNCIVSQSFLHLIKSLNCTGNILCTKKYVLAKGSGVTVMSKIIDIPYPNYMRVIPKGKKSINIAKYKDVLINATKAVLPFANSITDLVRFEKNWIIVINRDMDKTVKVNINKEIFPFIVGFNGAYLLQVLNIAQGNLYIPESNTRGITIQSKDTTTLLMPLRILDDYESEYDLNDFTEIVPETNKPKTKKPNWKDMYEKLLIENEKLKAKAK